MITRKLIDSVIAEWWTGTTADGRASKYAARLEAGGGLVQTQRRELEMLAAMIARRWDLVSATDKRAINVGFAVGSDGQDEVRIEIRENADQLVIRWRPQGAGLDSVMHKGATLWQSRTRHRPAIDAASEAVIKQDPSTMTLADTHAAIQALKVSRWYLTEQFEAHQLDGSKPAATMRALEDLNVTLKAIRARHDDLNVERKAALRG